MLVHEFIAQIFHDMWAHKLRSLLALFGIVWGTIAVTVLLALGQGFYNKQMKALASLAEDTLKIFLGSTGKPYHGLPSERKILVKASFVNNLPQALPEIAHASPYLMTQGSLSKGIRQTKAMVIGAAPAYVIIRHWHANGRFLDVLDTKNIRRVVFLGAKLKQSLFANEEALGQQIIINGMPFTVIGVRGDRQQALDWDNYNAFIPYSTFIALWGDQDLEQFIVAAKDSSQVAATKLALTHYFAKQFYFDPTDKNVINTYDYSTFKNFYISFFRAIQWFLGLCGAFTLCIGGIGIANTLFLIVQERTQEIGLRKTMGAQNHHILAQILLETFVLVGIGGLVGMSVAVSIIQLLAVISLPGWLGTPVISIPIIITTGSILLLIGMLAGYFPARRAANMQPIMALAAPPC
jgi:putative ABC transport system permease protein